MIKDSAFRTVWAAWTLFEMLAILRNHPTFEIGSNHLTLFQLDKNILYQDDSMYIR